MYKKPTQFTNEILRFTKKNNNFAKNIENYIISEIIRFINSLPTHIAGYDEIYEHVIASLLSKYSFEAFDLEEILHNNFTEVKKHYWSIK